MSAKRFGWRLFGLCVLLYFLQVPLHGSPPDPGGGGWSWPTNILNSWTFSDTNSWVSDNGYAPISFTNLSASKMGNILGYSVAINSADPAWLRFNLVETNGATNLNLKVGTLTVLTTSS